MPIASQTLLGIILFLLLAVSVSNYSGLTKNLLPKTSLTVTAMPVSTLSKNIQLVVPGTVEGANSAVITAEISGQIAEVNVKEGQLVNPGQSLLKIQGTGVSTQASQRAPATISPQPNPEITAAAQANYDGLERQYSRYQKLLEQGAIARRQVDDLGVRLETARQALEEAQKITAQPASEGTSTQIVVQSGLANLTSSVGGIVRSLTALPGSTVQTGQPLLIVDSGSDVQVSIQLAQKDLYTVHTGSPVEILTDNPNEIILGQVHGIFPQAGPAAAFFRTQIRMNSAGLLKSGMAVKVRINTPASVPVRAVPAAALLNDQGEDYVYLAVNGKAVRQKVAVGDKLGEFLEITSALPDDAAVIITSLTALKDGAAITLQ